MKKDKKNKLFIVIYSFFLCIISVSLTLAVTAAIKANNDTISDFAMGYGYTSEMNEEISRSFDKFLAFGTLSAGDISNLGLISSDDQLELRNSRNGCNHFDYYLGTMDGRDVVIVVNPEDGSMRMFDSALEYKFKDVISEFEKQSGVILTDEFLTTSKYDNNLHRETGGILLCLKFENGESFSGEKPYFKAKINNRMYIVDKQ